MPMTSEETKLYNKKYYNKRIQKEKDNNEYKIECKLCGKSIIKSSLNTHLKTKYCSKHYQRKLDMTQKLNALKTFE
jgi:hypothetical protein